MHDSAEIRYHSSDDVPDTDELAMLTEPVAVVIRSDGSLDVYGLVGVVDERSDDRAPVPPKVWVLRWEDRHNDETSVHATYQDALSALASVAVQSLDGAHELTDEHAVSLWARQPDHEYDLAEYDVEGAPLEEGPIVTKTGRVLTDADIEALADEAERGYDISNLQSPPLRSCGHEDCTGQEGGHEETLKLRRGSIQAEIHVTLNVEPNLPLNIGGPGYKLSRDPDEQPLERFCSTCGPLDTPGVHALGCPGFRPA